MTRAAFMAGTVAALAVLLAGTDAALAHAILVESHPAIGASVTPGPVAIALRYNSRIDRGRSRVSLTRPDHSDAVLPIAPSSPEDALDTTIELAAGKYVLHWQVLATDGHITRGDVPFVVGKP